MSPTRRQVLAATVLGGAAVLATEAKKKDEKKPAEKKPAEKKDCE